MSKAERTRQLIVEATAPLFNKKGFAGTSISDMTEATGLTKGSIYGNFLNKDEVALAAFDHNLQQVRTTIAAEMAKQDSVRQQLLVYVKVYDNFLKLPFPTGGCPILNTSVEADDTHPGLKSRASEAVMAWKSLIMNLIERGKATREFKPAVDAEQTALTMIALIEGAIMIAKVTGKLNYRKAVMQSVEKLIREL
jgi:TetR/AcrR family transcriptional repressor of nem operon